MAELFAQIQKRYVPSGKSLGRGSFGTVIAAKDTVTNTDCAVKILDHATKNSGHAKRMLRELRLMRFFNHENILTVNDVIVHPDSEQFSNVYVVTDLMDTDLAHIVKSPQVTMDHIKYIMYQILRGLKALHAAEVLHRDLKPANILLTVECDVKIADLGLAREADYEMTEYVASRWWRAPELLIGTTSYNAAVDMWSVGCIFAELLGRRPLFNGRDQIDTLKKINNVLGWPDQASQAWMGAQVHLMGKRVQSLQARKAYAELIPTPAEKIPLKQIFPEAGDDAISLLEQLLQFDPGRRLSAERALSHPFLVDYHDPTDEPGSAKFDADVVPSDLATLRVLIYEEAEFFKAKHKRGGADVQGAAAGMAGMGLAGKAM